MTSLTSFRPAAAALLLAARLAAAAPAADAITSLPGWSGALPSRMWSGFLSGGSDVQGGVTYAKEMWYMAAECEQPDPSKCPVILWSNGGPGASSAYGFFTELGPFTLSSESLATSPPTLFRNPYSWTTLATVVILNGPAPVGYSYCSAAGPSGSFASCGSWNDTRTAVANEVFVRSLFAAFPEFSSRDFYLVGESYAGVYLTQLTELLLAGGATPNLRGLALGDACMGTEVLCGPGRGGPFPSLLFRAGMACMSLQTTDRIFSECPYALLRDGPMEAATPACRAAVAQADVDCPESSFGAEGYNYLDECPPDPFDAQRRAGGGALPAPPAQPSGYPCGGDGALKTWVTDARVKAALHVAPNAAYHSGDNGAGFTYNVTFPSALPLMNRLQTGVDGVRVLVYNGATDPGISVIRTSNWTYDLGFPVEEAWRPWVQPNSSVVLGHVVQWQGNFHQATILGAGHMVPGFKPWPALLMLDTWLSGAAWPRLPDTGAKEAALDEEAARRRAQLFPL